MDEKQVGRVEIERLPNSFCELAARRREVTGFRELRRDLSNPRIKKIGS
jgi:hypothetical protein